MRTSQLPPAKGKYATIEPWYPPTPDTCRRGILRIGALGLLSLTLADCLRGRARAGTSVPASTRRAVFIFLQGGPSHHDTFDPKPSSGADIRGEFDTLATTLPGIRFAEVVPLLATRTDRLALLRAVTHRQAAHEAGVAYMTTGYSFRPGHNFPTVGAVVGHERRGGPHGLPPHVSIPDGGGAGHLGPAYNPLYVPGDPADPNFRVTDLAPADEAPPDRMRTRRNLLARVNKEFRRTHSTDLSAAADKFTAQAYDLITSAPAQAAFDLSGEPGKVRDRYGRTPIGQRLLLARRLVAAGVPFVTVTDPDWDHHQRMYPSLRRQVPAVDCAVSALIDDLADRGLLDETLVVLLGEFGRTPKINKDAGRDHWSDVFSVVLAGGGVKGGRVIGASDADGAFPKERPVTPEELVHTLYLLLGIDPEKFLPSTSGRDVQIVRDGKFIPELTQ